MDFDASQKFVFVYTRLEKSYVNDSILFFWLKKFEWYDLYICILYDSNTIVYFNAIIFDILYNYLYAYTYTSRILYKYISIYKCDLGSKYTRLQNKKCI